MSWTNEGTFRFIELYQKEACIWNPKNKYHKDKIKVNDAWLRIANAMGVPVAELKKKKETLMSSFRLNHKKVLASRKSSAGEDETHKPIWIFYDAMAAFILDVYECKSIITTEDHAQDECSLEKELSSQLSSQVSHNLSAEVGAEVETENDAQASPRVSIPVQKRRSHKPVELQETNTQVKNALSTLNNVLSESKKKQYEDECDLYGRLIANKLKKFAESDRQELMYEIDGLVLKKRRLIDARSSTFHKKVLSPSQIIISSRNRPSTSRSTHDDYSQPVYIVDNRPSSSQSNYSVPSPVEHPPIHCRSPSILSTYSSSTPNSIDFNYQQPSSIDSTVTSSPQVFTTNQPSLPPELHIPNQSKEAYRESQYRNDILLKAVSEAQLLEYEDN